MKTWHAKVPLLIVKGRTIPQIAHDLDVSRSAVQKLCERRGWKPRPCHVGSYSKDLRHRIDNMPDFDELEIDLL
jgi:hypothetical protein